MTRTSHSTELTPVNRGLSGSLDGKVTPEGKLTPEAWKGVRKSFLLYAALGDYVSEMCTALASRCRELAEEVENDPVTTLDTEPEKPERHYGDT